MIETKNISLSLIEANKGQIKGLSKNPRLIKDAKFQRLVMSISENPEMLELRELLVYPYEGKYVLIGGNMRYKALKELGYKEAPCKIIPSSATIDQLKQYTIKDNSGFGEWDFDLLANEWDIELLDACGVDLPKIDFAPQEDEEETKKSEEFFVKIICADQVEQSAIFAKMQSLGLRVKI